MLYEFTPDGSTRCVCVGGEFGEARSICPHYGGNCRALGQNMHTRESHDEYLRITRGGNK